MLLYCASVRNEIKEGKFNLIFSDEIVFRLFYYPFNKAATDGNFSDLWYAGWSNPVSSMLVLGTLSQDRILSFSSNCSTTLVLDG